MLAWALIFLAVTVVAAVVGFVGGAVASAGTAQVIFFLFLVAFVISLTVHLVRGGGTGNQTPGCELLRRRPLRRRR